MKKNGERHQLELLSRLLILSLLATFATSFKAWQINREVPTGPLFHFLFDVPNWVHQSIFSICLMGCCFVLFRPKVRFGYTVILMSWSSLAALDLLRVSTYIYYYMIWVAVLWWFSGNQNREREVCSTLKSVIFALYFWSGLQKLNYGFAGEIFPWVVRGFFSELPVEVAFYLGILSALFEMLIGPLLLFERTKRASLLAVVGLHLVILLCFGPLGLNRAASVWPWNVFQIAAVILLFGGSSYRAIEVWRAKSLNGLVVRMLVWFMPVLNLFHLWPDFLSLHTFSGSLHQAKIVAEPEFVRNNRSFVMKTWGTYRGLLWFGWSNEDNGLFFFPSEYYFKTVFWRLCKERSGLERPIRLLIYRHPIGEFANRPVEKWISCKETLKEFR